MEMASISGLSHLIKERVKGQVVLFAQIKKKQESTTFSLSFLTLDLRGRWDASSVLMEREKFVTGNARKDIPGAHLFCSARVSAQVARIAAINSSGKDSTICNQCPELAAEADGWDASKELAGGNQRMQWICSKGHKWEATMTNRVRGKDVPRALNMDTTQANQHIFT